MNMDYMFLHVFILWLNALATTVLVGAVVFQSAVLQGALAVWGPASMEAETVRAEGRRHLRSWIAVCIILLVIVSAIDLILRAQMMSRRPLSQVITILPLVLVKTHFGKVWFDKMAVLTLFALLWLFLANKPRWGVTLFLWIAAAGLCFTASLSGHAADSGDWSFPVLVDWVHFVMVSIWVGGLFPLRLILPKLVRPLEKQFRLKLEADVLRRFSTLAVVSVLLVVLSGVFNAWLRLHAFSNLFSTAYGITLLFKLMLVLPLLGLGAVNRVYTRPALLRLAGQPLRESGVQRFAHRVIVYLGGGWQASETEDRRLERGFLSEQIAMMHLKLLVAVQCLVAVLVLVVAVMLTQTSPPPRPESVSSATVSDSMAGSMNHSMDEPSMNEGHVRQKM